MDRLWAPWRIKYVGSKKEKKCIFCQAAKAKKDNYVLLKTKYSVSILNIFPYNNGHIMVSPLKHTADLDKLTKNEILDLFATLNKSKKILDKVLKPDAYNIGVNLGKSAGAGIAMHLHIHIVPRWHGDTNFMPTLYNTKIISQSLKELYKRLINAKSKRN